MPTRLSVLGRVLLLGAACGLLPRAALSQSADVLDGRIVREIRVTGLRKLSPDVVTRHMTTRVGEPFRAAHLPMDQRQLDELRLFSAVVIEPRLENDAVTVHVGVAETLRLLPAIAIRVTDENGFSAGPGLRGINLLGLRMQSGISVLFGGETSVTATLDAPTTTPGTWTRHVGFGYANRRNSIYDFDERSTTANVRTGRNWRHGMQTGAVVDFLSLDTGSSGESLSADGSDTIPTLGTFVTLDALDSSTNPRTGTWAEVEVDRLLGDARSWTFIVDGRRYQRFSERQGLGFFSLATFQTGEVGVDLPDYLQFALGGANSVRGWSLGSERGRNQFIGTLEYAYVVRPVSAFSVAHIHLYAGLQLVAFGDVGYAWNEKTDLKTTPAIDGYGVGLRFLVPFVDVVRLDAAWGEPGRGASAYFSVSLKAARQRQRVR